MKFNILQNQKVPLKISHFNIFENEKFLKIVIYSLKIAGKFSKNTYFLPFNGDFCKIFESFEMLKFRTEDPV